MKTKKTKRARAIILSYLLFIGITINAQTTSKQNFINAKNEIENMLNGKTPLDYERAIFITENAYYDNKLNYSEYSEFIDLSANYAFELAKKLNASNVVKQKQNILISKDSSAINLYRASANYAIYKLITDTTIMVFNKNYFMHFPFVYSYSDPLASKNWNYSQLTNLYLDKSKQGNCNALTSLFKILSMRLNSNANLCTTQGHIFITHADANGTYYNVELASKAFPGTGSIETITHTSDEAARNGIAMRELNLRQSVGLCLLNLAKGYQHKFNIKDDSFIFECAELALQYDNLNLNAMLLKAEVLEERLVKQNLPFSQIKTNNDFLKYQIYITNLYKLGYREMPTEMKNQVIAAITKDNSYIAISKDKTYYPFLNIDKSNKRSASLSNGTFEEVDIDKPIENYSRTIFDTKAKKIIAFSPPEKLYKDYVFDPVVFAWQIDPLFKKYPEISPYAAFMNNPVYYIDPDGADVIGGDDFMKKNSNTTAFKIFTQSQTALTFVKMFASANGNLFTSPQSGALARHNLKFSTQTGGDYGETKLMVVGADGKSSLYKSGMAVDASTKFEINIGVYLGMGNSKGDAGYAAGVINHEAFVHAEAYANLLSQWEDRENSGMTLEQFTTGLNALQDKNVPNKEHDAMKNGQVQNFVNTFKQINSYFKSIIDSKTSSKEEVKEASSNQEGFNNCSTEDCPEIEKK